MQSRLELSFIVEQENGQPRWYVSRGERRRTGRDYQFGAILSSSIHGRPLEAAPARIGPKVFLVLARNPP